MNVLFRQILGVSAFLFLAFNLAVAQVPSTVDDVPEDDPSRDKSLVFDNSELIHYGDLLDVDVVGSTEFDWRGEITSDGFLGGLGFTEDPVYALCRDTSEVASEIQTAYSKFLKNPVVSVEILDKSKRPLVTLYGAVRQPQRFRLMRPVSLKELIVLTGGFSENASGLIEVVRQPFASCTVRLKNLPADEKPGSSPPKDGDTKFSTIKISDLLAGLSDANPVVHYGDVITVQTAKPVYIIGDVENPGTFSLSEGLTVSRAISAAGGVAGKESKAGIRLFRRNSSGTDVIEISTGDVVKVDADTFELNEYDIIEVFGTGNLSVRYPPVLRNADSEIRRAGELPIRVVD